MAAAGVPTRRMVAPHDVEERGFAAIDRYPAC